MKIRAQLREKSKHPSKQEERNHGYGVSSDHSAHLHRCISKGLIVLFPKRKLFNFATPKECRIPAIIMNVK